MLSIQLKFTRRDPDQVAGRVTPPPPPKKKGVNIWSQERLDLDRTLLLSFLFFKTCPPPHTPPLPTSNLPTHWIDGTNAYWKLISFAFRLPSHGHHEGDLQINAEPEGSGWRRRLPPWRQLCGHLLTPAAAAAVPPRLSRLRAAGRSLPRPQHLLRHVAAPLPEAERRRRRAGRLTGPGRAASSLQH